MLKFKLRIVMGRESQRRKMYRENKLEISSTCLLIIHDAPLRIFHIALNISKE